MKTAIFKGVKQMACEEHAEPTIIDGGDAIIRVVRACVCGSDLWFYRDGSKEPNTQAGHEAIGVVEQIGDDVTARYARPVSNPAAPTADISETRDWAARRNTCAFPRPMARWWSFRATRRASPTKCSHRCSPSLT